MKRICLGKIDTNERIELDFEEERIRMIGLFGVTGSGKSIFHNNLYRELSMFYSPDEIGFVFCDMICVEFPHWKSDYVMNYIQGPMKAIEFMETLAESEEIKKKKYIFLHIEECDMAYADRGRLENALSNIINRTSNVYIIYSTSRPDPSYLDGWLGCFINLKVVFAVASKDDSTFLLGNSSATYFNKAGQRVLDFNNKQIYCRPFSDEEVSILRDFEL